MAFESSARFMRVPKKFSFKISVYLSTIVYNTTFHMDSSTLTLRFYRGLTRDWIMCRLLILSIKQIRLCRSAGWRNKFSHNLQGVIDTILAMRAGVLVPL